MAKENKAVAVTKAKKTARLQKKGDTKKSHKTYTKVRFYKPKTLKLARKPKYARSVKQSLPNKDGFDKYAVLLRPVATEKAMKKMEEENTMVGFKSQSRRLLKANSSNRAIFNIEGVLVRTQRLQGSDQGGFQETLQHQGAQREHADSSRRQKKGVHQVERGQRLLVPG